MRRLTLLALAAAALSIPVSRPAAAILPGDILVEPAFATPSDTIVIDLSATAVNPCVLWRFAGRLGNTLTVEGVRSDPGCPATQQRVVIGSLEPGRYHALARVPGDPSPLFGQVFFDVRPSPGPDLVPSEVVLSPAQPTTLDPLTIVVSSLEVGCGPLVYSPPAVDGDTISIDVFLQTSPFPVPCPFRGTSGRTFALPPLAAGLKTLALRSNHQPYLTRHFAVVAPPDHLELGQRFAVDITWTDAAGVQHTATPSALSDDSGYFWFFARDNVEMTVKMLDGRALNGWFWFFAASMTDLPYRIEVIENGSCPGAPAEPPCPVRFYESPGGNRNFIDTRSFAGPPG